MAQEVFARQPSEADVCALLDRAIQNAGRAPRYIVTDKGVQFRDDYKRWCARRGVTPRFGAVGKKGSVAVIERFIRTLKGEGLRPILLPLRLEALRVEIAIFANWYNLHRSHQGLGGATPADRLHSTKTLLRPRARGGPGRRDLCPLELRIRHFEGRKHLPIVELRPAA